MNPNFRRVVDALQAIPFEKCVFEFVFDQPLGRDQNYMELAVALPYQCFVPLLEAIGMRLRWCAEQTIDRPKSAPFNGDAALDAERLLIALSVLMRSAYQAALPVRRESFKIVQQALAEVTLLADGARAGWEEGS